MQTGGFANVVENTAQKFLGIAKAACEDRNWTASVHRRKACSLKRAGRYDCLNLK
jgi:hypothetical protein